MAKDLPGQIYDRNEEPPSEPPLPYFGFALDPGTVSCTYGSNIVRGTNTLFLTELTPRQSVKIAGETVVIASITDDTTLILERSWERESVSNVPLYIRKIRPFTEFLGNQVYNETAPLGASGLVLRDFMPNFKRPVREISIDGELPPGSTWSSNSTGVPGNTQRNVPQAEPLPDPADSQRQPEVG